ncbi:hypothetical protein KJK76_001903, partial [Campylobacter jejuni]|nr:hypothetical protein [Campylobacter jejuni]
IAGVNLASGSSIKTFTNGSDGFISGNKGINLTAGSSIETFNNSGTIQGPQVGIQTNATINTFTNNGLINSPGSGEWSNGIWMSGSSNIDTFTNTGSIQGGGTGIRMAGGTISTFDNKGLIKTNSADGYGIYITGEVNIQTLKNTGTIQGATQNGDGIRIKGSNVTINQIDNSGIIESADEAIGIKDWDYRIKVHT